MKFTSITVKIIFLVISAFIIIAVSVIVIADRQLKKVIDDNQKAMYNARLQVIHATLSQRDARLQKTGLIDAYTEAFKTSAINNLKETYYTVAEQAIYPFIIDQTGTILAHPTMSSGDETFQQYEWIQQMVASEQGNLTATHLEQTNSYTYVRFTPWNWTICYVVPQEIKYAAAAKFNTILIYIIACIGLSMLAILSLLISRFTSPITKLTSVTKAMARGDLDREFKTGGTGEVAILARSFKDMRNSIQQTIVDLQNENVKRRTAEKKFRSLVENLNDWVWEIDKNGLYTYASPTVYTVLGFTPEEILGKTPFDFMEPKEATRVRKIFGEYIEKKSTFKNIINTNLHKNGQKVVLESSGQTFFDETGIFKGYRGVDRDITSRQQSEEALQAEKELLSVTLRSIGDAVITTDINGNIIFLNKIAEELTGWTNEQAEGKSSTEVFHIINEKTGEECVSPIQQVLIHGKNIGMANHTALVARDGSSRSIADSGAPIRDRKSNIIGVVLVFRDISHEKKTEEELLKIRKLESVGVLAGGIAHDFNNILSAILGNIELAGFRITEEDVETTSLLANAKKAAKRATKLTGQLLTFSKGGDPIKEATSLTALITDSANFVLHGSNVVCNFSFADHLWMVDVDSGQISQVIQNIIINAKQAMHEGGTITIKCANVKDNATEPCLKMDKGDYVRITIQDTGSGIQDEIIAKIFDPYFTTKQEGSGLGLAICHSIITKHDGHITVSSTIGTGTTFSLFLPALRSTHDKSEPRQETRPPVKTARVLVMDDEEMLRDIVKAQLRSLGHEPILAEEGNQAIRIYQEMLELGTPIDIVIMDLTIPGGMGGQKAAQKLLQIDAEAKIIVASGYSNDPVMANYKKYGFCTAIVKPFDLTELSNSIASTLDIP